MNSKQHWARFCSRLVPIASATAAFFMTFSVLFFYEKSSNYFERNAVIPMLAVIWAFLAFAAAVVFAIVIPKEEIAFKIPFGTNLLFALPAALGFGAGAIFTVTEFAKSQATWALVATFILLLSAAHVLLSETDRAIPFLGFAPPIACAFIICILYFDFSLEMNAPLKAIAQCALIPLMLYFTTELRYLLGRATPRLYLALALGSIAASSLCILAIPTASIMGLLNNSNCLAASLIAVGATVTIFLRLKRFLTSIPFPDENEMKETDAQ